MLERCEVRVVKKDLFNQLHYKTGNKFWGVAKMLRHMCVVGFLPKQSIRSLVKTHPTYTAAYQVGVIRITNTATTNLNL